jgi:hypothetical protein
MLRDGGEERVNDNMRGSKDGESQKRGHASSVSCGTAGSAGSMGMTTGDKDQHLEAAAKVTNFDRSFQTGLLSYHSAADDQLRGPMSWRSCGLLPFGREEHLQEPSWIAQLRLSRASTHQPRLIDHAHSGCPNGPGKGKDQEIGAVGMR